MTAEAEMPPSSELLFSTFRVSSQAFYRTPLSFALVNLKPIVPGHVLICPKRVVPRLSALRPDEVADLFLAVQRVAAVVEEAYGGQSCTVSCQDGPAAGQSVPHVHVHVLPRQLTDFDGVNDRVYDALEEGEHALADKLAAEEATKPQRRPQGEKLKMDADEDRIARGPAEMEKEAAWLAGFFKDE